MTFSKHVFSLPMSKNRKQITKAVIAAAGYGTRFLPATKNQPKEMLPIVDKPIIQYLVEEAVAAGVTDIVIVTRMGSSAVDDHFDSNVELERVLEATGKTDYLEQVRRIPMMANYVYVRQKDNLPYGNGSPLLAAKHLIDDDESFLFMFGDDLVFSQVSACKQLVDLWEKDRPSSFLAVQEVPWEEVHRYGVVTLDPQTADRIIDIVEKPQRENAPSNLVIYGRAILNYHLFDYLAPEKTGQGGELWLWDSVKEMAQDYSVRAAKLEGEWMTTGDPIRYLKTIVRFALERPDIGPEFREYLKGLDL